jgi:hypothetical protein
MQGLEENLPLSGIEPRSPDCPARSQTLYCQSYYGSLIIVVVIYQFYHYAVNPENIFSFFVLEIVGTHAEL